MTDTLSGTREAVAALLTTDEWPVHPKTPGRLAMPLGIVYPADPYLVDGAMFGTFDVSFEVRLIAQAGTNETTIDALDVAITDAVVALTNGGWTVNKVTEPGTVSISNGQHLAVELHITNTIQF